MAGLILAGVYAFERGCRVVRIRFYGEFLAGGDGWGVDVPQYGG
jgi:hypothetical protein